MKKNKSELIKEVKRVGYRSLISIILALVIFNIAMYLSDGISPLGQIRIYEKSKDNIQNLATGDWEIKQISRLTIEKKQDNYLVYVRTTNEKINKWSNDFIEVDKNGNIIKEELTEDMKFWENMADLDKINVRDIDLNALEFNYSEVYYESLTEEEIRIIERTVNQVKPILLEGVNNITFLRSSQFVNGIIASGTYHNEKNTIKVSVRNFVGGTHTEKSVRRTFCHEIMHHLLDSRRNEHEIIDNLDMEICYK